MTLNRRQSANWLELLRFSFLALILYVDVVRIAIAVDSAARRIE
ncbi:MAG TPA: hypothetical protein VFQ30_16000 [Ktedonobacteraceae bacterium]|nr:hypothetical protein [Ktedonobacteraceae bacterium]